MTDSTTRKRTRRDAATTPIVNVPAPLERALADLRRDARDDAEAATLLADVERVLDEAPACDRGKPQGVKAKTLADLPMSWPETSWGMEVAS